MKLVSPEKRFNFSFKFIGKLVLFPVAALLVFSYQYSATADTEKEVKNVLILLPDERGRHTQTLIEKGIRSAIDTATEFRIVYYVEFMDLNRFGDPTHYQLLLDLYRYKYSGKEIHLVIPYGNTKIIVDAGIQYQAAYKDDEGWWLDGANNY